MLLKTTIFFRDLYMIIKYVILIIILKIFIIFIFHYYIIKKYKLYNSKYICNTRNRHMKR